MSLFAGTLSDPLAYGLADVRFGSLADIATGSPKVRFVPIADLRIITDNGCSRSWISMPQRFQDVKPASRAPAVADA
jgi:hypothetical protein